MKKQKAGDLKKANTGTATEVMQKDIIRRMGPIVIVAIDEQHINKVENIAIHIKEILIALQVEKIMLCGSDMPDNMERLAKRDPSFFMGKKWKKLYFYFEGVEYVGYHSGDQEMSICQVINQQTAGALPGVKKKDLLSDTDISAITLLNGIVTNKIILDATCGTRMLHFEKKNPDVLYADIRDEEITICDGSVIKIKPDIQMDFRKMPFKDNTFKMVVFDPPHIQGLSPNCLMGQKFGSLLPTWRTDLKAGFDECMRVLEPQGVLIFKWNETQVTITEVLKIFQKQPLFGHPTGKQGKTIWVCFMKPAKTLKS